jgi:NADH:ubiquinone oxidoreductase subunit 2 (subunit N)
MRQSLSATTGLIKLLFASVIGLTLVNILDAVTLSMESTKITGNIFILVMTTLSLVCIITETRNLNGISIIIFIVVAGYIVALDTETFINLYLALEVAAFGSYALIGANTNRLTSIEGAIKYFLGTSISSLSLILGISILYSSTGSTNIGLISQSF